MQGESIRTASSSTLPHPTPSQPTTTSLGSLTADSITVRYHVIHDAPHDSDCESGIVRSSVQLELPATRSHQDGNSPRSTSQRTADDRRRSNRYRNRRNKIGLLLVFAALLLFAGLVICANTKEYVAGATISVIGVIIGSSSMVLCLIMTDSCGRVHGFRERGWSRSQSSQREDGNASAENRQSPPRHGDGTLLSAANASHDVHGTAMNIQNLPPNAVCSLSGDFLDHLPPPLYETSEILRQEAVSLRAGEPGAVGVSNNYQYYKVSQCDDNLATHALSGTNIATTSAATVADTSHLCEECVHRQHNLDASGTVYEEQLLLAPAIVVELPTYDEAIAEDEE